MEHEENTFETIVVGFESPVGTVVLNRPERVNALSLGLIDELCRALETFDLDKEVRGVMLTGSERAFSAGADLNEALAANNVPACLRYLSKLRKVGASIENLSKPVVAVIRGYCFTGGLELAMACDLRFAGESAQFAITSAQIGSVAGMGGTQRLPRLVGMSNAKDILLSGRRFDAQEALSMGLVDRVYPDDEVIAKASEWIKICAERAPLAVWLQKLALNLGTEINLESALSLESLLTTIASTTKDRAEGMSAVLEKRQPVFEGR